MNELYKYGFNEDILNSMIKVNPGIKNLTKESVDSKINLLKSVNTTDEEIFNIIKKNPLYLTKNDEDIKDLLDTLNSYNFTDIGSMLETNPDILNIPSSNIEIFIDDLIEMGANLEDIISELELMPDIFDEII